MALLEPVVVQPIGVVHNSLGRRRYDEWRETESDIIVNEAYEEALSGLEEYSHVEVLFYLHEVNRSFVSMIHPTGNPELPLVGAFATRTPNRPSKIALTTCRLLGVDGNRLKVKGLDAYDGSPVLDVKPHFRPRHEEVTVPSWVMDLNRRKQQ
jgi:tRNA-Thr(GGU) m(6)t(6)A37 methyltransferase TsaA